MTREEGGGRRENFRNFRNFRGEGRSRGWEVGVSGGRGPPLAGPPGSEEALSVNSGPREARGGAKGGRGRGRGRGRG